MNRSISKSIILNNGKAIPFMGLGSWETRNADEIVESALEVGYRCIDTASLHGNERLCGEGILNWLKKNPDKKREEVFYITKLWNNVTGYDRAKFAIKECLKKVEGLKYIDLLLIHLTTEGKTMRLETWKAMQEAVDEGIVKSIGVSNYGSEHIEELLNWEGLKYKPVVNEIQVSPWCMRQKLCNFTRKNDIDVIAFAPLSDANRIYDEDVIKIAKNKKVSDAQVLIRWLLQKGYIPIPKTRTISRLAENLDVLNFELTEGEIKALDHPNVHDPSDWEVTTCRLLSFYFISYYICL